jgi:hypothetical protein
MVGAVAVGRLGDTRPSPKADASNSSSSMRHSMCHPLTAQSIATHRSDWRAVLVALGA